VSLSSRLLELYLKSYVEIAWLSITCEVTVEQSVADISKHHVECYLKSLGAGIKYFNISARSVEKDRPFLPHAGC
jgi:hypothetical protein